MLNPISRAHLPAVRFSPRAYMGCGGWDLARAPEATALSRPEDLVLGHAATRRPRKTMGCGSGGFPSQGVELVEPDEAELSCGGGGSGGYTPSFMRQNEEEGPIETLKPGLSGPRVRMGCGDEMCEECERKAGMGCPKCKRVRQRAMMNQQDEMDGIRKLGQSSLPDTSVLVVSGLALAGLFYLVTR